ncbi:MAG: hypothetical protein WDW38_011231 [Sanguina aurantia]
MPAAYRAELHANGAVPQLLAALRLLPALCDPRVVQDLVWTLVLLLDPHNLPKDAAVLQGDGSSMRALRAEMLQTLVPLLHALSWPAADGHMRHVMAVIVRALHLTLAEDDECKESLRGSGAVTLLASLIGLLAREPATLLPPPLQPAPPHSGSISRNVSTTLATSQLPQPPTRERSHTSLAGTSSSQGAGTSVGSNGLDNAETALAGHARRHADLHSAPFDSVVVSDTPVVTPWTRLLAVALLQAAARLAPAGNAAAAVGAATPVAQQQADQPGQSPATGVVDATAGGSRWEANRREHGAVNGQESVSDPGEGAEGSEGGAGRQLRTTMSQAAPLLACWTACALHPPPLQRQPGMVATIPLPLPRSDGGQPLPPTAADDGDSDVSFVEEEGSEYCPPTVGTSIRHA